MPRPGGPAKSRPKTTKNNHQKTPSPHQQSSTDPVDTYDTAVTRVQEEPRPELSPRGEGRTSPTRALSAVSSEAPFLGYSAAATQTVALLGIAARPERWVNQGHACTDERGTREQRLRLPLAYRQPTAPVEHRHSTATAQPQHSHSTAAKNLTLMIWKDMTWSQAFASTRGAQVSGKGELWVARAEAQWGGMVNGWVSGWLGGWVAREFELKFEFERGEPRGWHT